jgi:hypothetical protein
VVFTAGGTEGDNLAVKGIYWARRGDDPRRTRAPSWSSCRSTRSAGSARRRCAPRSPPAPAGPRWSA